MLKKLLISTAIASLMAGTAVAQGAPPGAPGAPAMKDQSTPGGSAKIIGSQSSSQWLASKFRGTDVVGADNQTIGNVSDVLFDKSGQIQAYIISVGGFLGMGSKLVALAPTSFQVVSGQPGEYDKLRLSMSKDELQQAQNFEPYNPPSTTGAATGTAPRRPSPLGGTPPGSTNR